MNIKMKIVFLKEVERVLKLKRKTVKERSQKQESKVAKEVKGRVVPASGALDNFKGDVRSLLFLIECKTTEKDYYVFSMKTWDKIVKEALKDNLREPVLQIDIEDGNKRLCALKYETFEDLMTNSDREIYLSNMISVGEKGSIRVREAGIYTFDKRSILIVDWDYFLNTLTIAYEDNIIPF